MCTFYNSNSGNKDNKGNDKEIRHDSEPRVKYNHREDPNTRIKDVKPVEGSSDEEQE